MKTDWDLDFHHYQEDRQVALGGLAKDLIDNDVEFLKELWQNWTEE